MGYEANLCSPYYISRPSLKNVSRVFNEIEAVTQQREKGRKKRFICRDVCSESGESGWRQGADSATFPLPSSALILSLVEARPPVLTFEEQRRQPHV